MVLQSILDKQKAYFKSNETKSIAFRLNALKTLKAGILAFEEQINEALRQDLGKHAFEAYFTEVGIVLSEISYIEKRLKSWAKPKRKKSPLLLFPARSYQYAEPYGTVLIMSPWNYPFQLAIIPLIGAIAAGNTAIIKPASYAEATSKVIDELIRHCFREVYVTTVLGGREENKQLLDLAFDYIFFTGSTEVGKLVMEKASKHLIPITLELGGKSPCIIDRDVNLKLTAKRIAFGKYLNAGQTCIAPDYVWIPAELKADFISNLKAVIHEFFGENPLLSPELPKIVNTKHMDRLIKLMSSEKIVIGGDTDGMKIAPTVLEDIAKDAPIMQEEIFGPILPILTYTSMTEVIEYIQANPKPLALYLFTNDRNMQQTILDHISFGGATFNDTMMHFASTEIGFGGVGMSGMGRYHGRQSFLTFSNLRSVVKRWNWLDIQARYHPYHEKKQQLLRKILK